MGYYTNKKVLIVGGTGTIGKGLVHELLKQNPSVIRIYSRDEYKQFVMQNEGFDFNILRFLIGDIRDYDRLNKAMRDVDVVFNLAAMKHVPACEYNPDEAIKTNVIGMENVIKAAANNGVECVVFTSSDKAINPTNSYGATKLLAEKLIQTANHSLGNTKTRFTAVRFGNVMGSRGSVIPLFKKQIEKYRKITVTNGNMTRFMMTLSQAVKLIMTAGETAFGGEIFVLKMPIIKLQHLAEVIIEETCSKLDIDKQSVHIENIGFRAGERNFEELMTKEESEYAFDLGEMYAVVPINFPTELGKLYKASRKAEVGSYNSSDKEPVTKEEVRELIVKEQLV